MLFTPKLLSEGFAGGRKAACEIISNIRNNIGAQFPSAKVWISVFANATDPAGGGYLGRVARPARNTTGFLNFEPRFGWKFLELLKQLYLKPRLLILDEPTSVLTPQEADEVLGHVRELTRAGLCTVLLITHKFREVMAYADDVTVLRRGRSTGRR